MGKGNRGRDISRTRWGDLMENLFIVILAFYPLRHIAWGIDFQDTGYNYANFQYMGTEHMDSMWLFSTYLANVAGNWLTKLPNGDTLMGMNLYTGLFVSLLALMGYFFCTRKLKMPKVIAFVGEMVAISMCWCPTAVLYNYLTYVLFLGSVILLYLGLADEGQGFFAKYKGFFSGEKCCLFGAGVLLGMNVLVRFSNLPEAAMIVAVWAYDFILWLEDRKEGGKFWPRLFRHTFWCLAGYVAALAMLFIHIDIGYGMGEYVAGIRRLFAMTDNAADYKPVSMIMGIIGRYVESMYWVIRMGVIAAGGVAFFALSGWLEAACVRGRGGDDFLWNHRFRIARMIHVGARVVWGMVCLVMLGWLYSRNFCSLLFYSYDSIWHPGPIFLLLAMFIALLRVFHRDSEREERLIGGMMILVILLTSIGSNNGVFPSLNNMFLAAPYTLWESWRFLGSGRDWKVKGGLTLYSYPVKGILTAFLALCLFLFGCFGAVFVFAEGTGVQDAATLVENNAVLRNVKMSPEKARWMSELSAYANEKGLQGKEVILYGRIPALSYYLQMPSAFNPWSDLPSYSLETMGKDMEELEGRISEKGAEKPVIIVESVYAIYEEGGMEALAQARLGKYFQGCSKFMGCAGALMEAKAAEREGRAMASDGKWLLLMDFMECFGYEQTFRNEKFAIYQ